MPETLGARSDLAAALTILRQLRGMRQDQLGAAAGVSSALLKKIEQDRRRARPGTLRANSVPWGSKPRRSTRWWSGRCGATGRLRRLETPR
jgi:hypothetical protein